LSGMKGAPISESKWSEFWKYFSKTWLNKYDPHTWNIFGLDNDFINRTNNPLERYNRRLNEEMGVVHPGLAHFVQILKNEADYYIALIGAVKAKKVNPPPLTYCTSYDLIAEGQAFALSHQNE
jgi:hypothetical protein